MEALRQAVLNVSAGWGGEAFNSFQGKSEEWNKHARGIHSALVQISQRVHAAGGDCRGGDLKDATPTASRNTHSATPGWARTGVAHPVLYRVVRKGLAGRPGRAQGWCPFLGAGMMAAACPDVGAALPGPIRPYSRRRGPVRSLISGTSGHRSSRLPAGRP